MKASINSIVYQLRICRQKTINISPFEAHFGRKANSLLSNTSTKPDPKSLTYKHILNKYLDLETVRWDELISEENWDVEARSDTELEHNRDKLSKDPEKESRMISHPEIVLPVPRTETSLAVKLAKKKPKTKRSKKSLDGCYEVLAPVSSVVKTNTYTSVIEEPGKRNVIIRNSDLAKFGTKAERQTEHQMYANRRPTIPSGKTTENLINQHAKEARRKLEGKKRMKHTKIADDASAVSSIHSNVTRALRVRMPTKPKRTVITLPPQPTTADMGDLAPPMELPLKSIVIAEPPTKPKRKAATKATAALQPLKTERSSSITESDEFLASVQTCPPTTSSSTAPSRSKRRQLIKKTQIQNKSVVASIKKAATQSQHVETDFTVGPCSPVQTYPIQYYISPNNEGPESSMTVGEAERLYESDTD